MAHSTSPHSPSRLLKHSDGPTADDKSTTKTAARTAPSSLQHGELHVSVVALKDLPLREQPSYMTLKVHRNGKSLSTGPPTSRHKDRNSFKFASPLSQDLVVPSKTLSSLYVGTLYVEVVYEKQPHQNLTGSFPVRELCVNEEKPRNVVMSLTGKDHSTVVIDLLDDTPPPTLELKLQLKGSLRPEMATLQHLCRTWFGFMDQVEASCQTLLIQPVSQVNKTFFVVPALPLATAALVLTPIGVGLCVACFPIFIPVLCAAVSLAACLALTGFLLFASTSTGRTWLQQRLPLSKLVQSESGQALLYPTGPRPNPVRLTRTIVPAPDDMWGRLVLSLAVDAIGSASYFVPIVGEFTDVAWAPLQTILIMALYDTTTPHLKYVSFAEELLPFTDFVPSATIGWAAQFGPQLLNNKTAANTFVVPTDLVLQETGVSAKQK